MQFYISSLYVNTCVCRGLFQVVSYFEWSACNRQGHFGNGSLSLSTKNLNLRIQEIDLSRKTWNKFILFCLTTSVDWIHYLILPRIKIPFEVGDPIQNNLAGTSMLNFSYLAHFNISNNTGTDTYSQTTKKTDHRHFLKSYTSCVMCQMEIN